MPLKNGNVKYLMENPRGKIQICSETNMGIYSHFRLKKLCFLFLWSPSLYFQTPKKGFRVMPYIYVGMDVYLSPS